MPSTQQRSAKQQRVWGTLADAADRVGPPVDAERQLDTNRVTLRAQLTLPVGSHAEEKLELELVLLATGTLCEIRDSADDRIVVGGEARAEAGIVRLLGEHHPGERHVFNLDGGGALVVVVDRISREHPGQAAQLYAHY